MKSIFKARDKERYVNKESFEFQNNTSIDINNNNDGVFFQLPPLKCLFIYCLVRCKICGIIKKDDKNVLS